MKLVEQIQIMYPHQNINMYVKHYVTLSMKRNIGKFKVNRAYRKFVQVESGKIKKLNH